MDVAVRNLVDDAFARALEILSARRGDLGAGAGLLLERETLTAADFPPMGTAMTKLVGPQGNAISLS